ncbi:MAG: hypothetical protein GVY24_06000 [Planctomycetes bacterium]|jgi:hypothetical protein|nr:hypothetical protein [Planctomycetota bacterium]
MHVRTSISNAGAALVILAASAACCAALVGCRDSSAAAQAGDAAAVSTETELDFEAHAEALRERWGAGFVVLIEKPFIIVGDQPEPVVQRHAERTVRWAVDRLKAEYFEHDPDHIITIYLFGGKQSYEKHATELTGRKPHTPFGFYSPGRRMMVMNIATGGGTLVHEIVHPFVAANFPDCPAWFNEGLGSLYEQSAERDGRIIGKTNWRLAGLQRAITDGKAPSFADLCATTTDEFYGEHAGVNYATARYLCYYLQERGKLRNYYHAFVKHHHDDPTGYDTLVSILGDDGRDMPAFERDWQRWVLKLRFP